jgi:hypothetical protein
MGMDNPNEKDLISVKQPVVIQKTLDALPGLIGALDTAIMDHAGERLPFVLLVFAGNGAMHATNLPSAAEGVNAVKQLVKAWETDGEPS